MYEDIELDLITTPQVWHRPWSAIILDTVTDANSVVRVVIPDIDPQRPWGPCSWTPNIDAGGVVYPTKNDKALVHFDEDRKCWIVKWIPDSWDQG